QAAKLQAYDVVLLDTAGRLHVDDQLMAEMKAVHAAADPAETLLVVDSLTGQDAVNVAKGFAGEVELSGVILTRMDGDARGGAALSMRAVTGKPIKFAGTGEGIDALEAFHPSRVAGRILGMGDVVSLVERAAETVKIEDAEKIAAKMAKGKFDLDDLRTQIAQMQRMGGLGALAGMLPGMKGLPKGPVDDKALVRLEAMMSSMTAKERGKPEIINAKRKIRIAKGSGTTVQEVNKLLKMHQEMATAMKRLKKLGGFGKLAAMFSGGGMEKALGGMAGGQMPGLPGLPGGSGGGFNLPPGFDKFGKK
ncbi:MAG TPA: signal recognition particle protein, partial [Sphingomicrobium sp.]|nr:signal recognition particle protein [Sphingomicrobium sp.]